MAMSYHIVHVVVALNSSNLFTTQSVQIIHMNMNASNPVYGNPPTLIAIQNTLASLKYVPELSKSHLPLPQRGSDFEFPDEHIEMSASPS